jgi:hypothetical protein
MEHTQQITAKLRTLRYIVIGKRNDAHAQRLKKRFSIQLVAISLTVHISYMGAKPFNFINHLQRARQPGKIRKVRPTAPVQNFVFRMKMIEIPIQRPPNVAQKR